MKNEKECGRIQGVSYGGLEGENGGRERKSFEEEEELVKIEGSSLLKPLTVGRRRSRRIVGFTTI